MKALQGLFDLAIMLGLVLFAVFFFI